MHAREADLLSVPSPRTGNQELADAAPEGAGRDYIVQQAS